MVNVEYSNKESREPEICQGKEEETVETAALLKVNSLLCNKESEVGAESRPNCATRLAGTDDGW